jgi:hypothetical protein
VLGWLNVVLGQSWGRVVFVLGQAAA